MRRVWVLGALVLAACATTTPRELAQRECTREVAHEMGYDVNPDGTWRTRGATVPGGKIAGSGTRVDACLKTRGY